MAILFIYEPCYFDTTHKHNIRGSLNTTFYVIMRPPSFHPGISTSVTRRPHSEGSLLSPPPEFSASSATGTVTPRTMANLEGRRLLKKEYDSEPCVLEVVGKEEIKDQHHQHMPHYRSADLSLKGLDKCSRLRARSFGQGSKPRPRTNYPLLAEKSPPSKKPYPMKLSVIRPGICGKRGFARQ